jgi:hypothetical protein
MMKRRGRGGGGLRRGGEKGGYRDFKGIHARVD